MSQRSMNRLVDTHQSTAWWRSHRATSMPAAAHDAKRSVEGEKGSRGRTPVCVAMRCRNSSQTESSKAKHHGGGMPVKAWPQRPWVLIPPQFSLASS